MHVGMAAIFQNPQKGRRDVDVYQADLALAELAEPMGFESVWSVEHHFSDYTMCPDVLQFLTYMAGRTRTAKLGSMVVVLPWHDPMRVAEQISMLDNISGGRMILGIGRGAGKIEFDGFRLDMGESRERFVECSLMILEWLESGSCAFDGKHYRQPKAAIRPAPFKSFRGRTYAAAVSPESARIMAELGVGLLIIPQKPWQEVAKELTMYRSLYREVNGAEAPQPISAGWVFVDEDEGRARELAMKYIGGYWQTVLEHYQFAGDHLKTTKGYEYYGKMSDKIRQYGNDGATEFFVNLQIWGTPEQVYQRIMDVHGQTNNSGFVGVFSYAGMAPEEARRNMTLFAEKVTPRLKAFDAGAPVDRAQLLTAVAAE